jgi:hypothetical protein
MTIDLPTTFLAVLVLTLTPVILLVPTIHLWEVLVRTVNKCAARSANGSNRH